jgi:hypothetical protein
MPWRRLNVEKRKSDGGRVGRMLIVPRERQEPRISHSGRGEAVAFLA